MAYDRAKASPSDAAHEAAASLDSVYEAVGDGFQLSQDIAAIFRLQGFLDYILVDDKGEMVSRIIQVASLVERDNSILNDLIDPADGE